MKILTQKGDTIVEVLIAMTILASVITGAYAISNKAMIAAQQAQERTQATKLAEGQVDRLKYLASLTDQTEFDKLKTPPKCINSDNNAISTNLASPATGCKDGIFHFYISNYIGGSINQFTIKVVWDPFHGSVQQNVTFLYRAQ